MDELIAAFRSAYPAHANTPWLAGLAGLPLPHQQRAGFAVAESLALSGRHAEAIDLARSLTRPLMIGPGWADVALDSLVTVAGATLEARGGDERQRVREVVEMLLDVARQYPDNALRRSVDARAALLHARVDDRVLAASRLRDFDAAPPPLGVIEGGQDEMRVATARRLLGAEWDAAYAEGLGPTTDSDSFGRVLRLTLAGLAPVPPDLTTAIESNAMNDAITTVREIATAIIDVRASIGPADTLLRPARALLQQAEEAVWLAPVPRSALWARLAAAASSVGLYELADRWAGAVVAEFDSVPSPPPPVVAEIVADLVRAASFEGLEWNPDGELTAPPVSAADPPSGDRPDPEPIVFPPTLDEVLASGNVLLVAGPELPEARGAPGRSALLARLVQETADPSIGDDARRGALLALSQGSVDLAARVLRATNEPVMAKVFEAYSQPPADDAYDFLSHVSFTGVVNMSWDSALLDAFAFRSPVVVHSQSDQVFTAAKSQEFAFTWFAGDPAVEEIAIGSNEVRSRLYADENLSRFLTGAAQSSSLLFVGVRASDVIEFFDALPASGGLSVPAPASSSSTAGNVGTSPGDTQHHAICVIDDLWSLNERELRTRGVVPIGYRAGDGQLAEVIRQLSHLARPVGPGDAPPLPPTSPSMLSRIMLTNIGAFDTLDLSLSPAWNLLLGNNGCGKSTVLRAVALGLCGDHPRAIEAGEGLLRAGCDSGAIELQVGASRYRTELNRSSGTVRVRTTSLTPLQQGHWAVLGFPALRGMSVTTPSGISSTQAPEPRVEDLLPLLLDEVDHRLDDIKQWIVNVEARAQQADGVRWQGLLDRFFDVLTELTPGATLEFASVDPSSWEVWVRTDDGVVSIDQLSQGMSSIIAWVGTLLQRMYDIYPTSPEPAAQGAFVLIDELDAHLHPAWQRLLPSLTRKHFPHVQYLATSHSPLVASSLQMGELFVATREPRKRPDGTEQLIATIAVADIDPRGLRADQILTSALFGLMTSRSPEHHGDVDRYSELYVKKPRTADEEAELARLRGTLANAYRDGETVAEREADTSAEGEIVAALAERTGVGGPDARRRAADAFADVEDAS